MPTLRSGYFVYWIMFEIYRYLKVDKTIDVWVNKLRYYDKQFSTLFAPKKLASFRYESVMLAIQCVTRCVEDLGWIPKDRLTTFYAEFGRIKPISITSSDPVEKVQPMWELVGGDNRLRKSLEKLLQDPSRDENWQCLKKSIDNLMFVDDGKEPWK